MAHMTGREMLNEELKKHGATKSQIDSRVVDMMLDIFSSNGIGLYVKTAEEEGRLEAIRSQIATEERRRKQQEKDARDYMAELREAYEEAKSEIDAFNESLTQCETEAGRDAMRIAQLFINTVTVDTKYDNTAFIIGLSAILSRNEINPLAELKKINPKLPYYRPTEIF